MHPHLPPTALAAYAADDGDTIWITTHEQAPTITVAQIVAVVDELAIASAVTPRSRILRPALITQLRDAVAPSLGSTGGGRGGGRGVPVDMGAFTLWEDITTRIEALHEDLEGESPVAGSHEQILLAWSRELVAAAQGPHGLNQDALAFALDRVTRIRDLIAHYFDPPTVREIVGAACLACNTVTVEIDVDGELIPTPAIITVRHGDGPLTVRCRACSGTWSLEDLDLRERFLWAQRRDQRIHDLVTPLTGDDWHHIRRELREAATHHTSQEQTA